MTVYDLKGGNIISAPQKSTAWNALSILERDLEMMYNSYRCENYQYYKVVNILTGCNVAYHISDFKYFFPLISGTFS